MARIPAYGKVVIIANHPLGALDALALIYLLQDIRKDIKILANDFLYSFDNLRELLIPIYNISGKMKKSLNISLYKQYAEVCEKGGRELMDFGVDREFSHCIGSY